jgi:hypothetical protein
MTNPLHATTYTAATHKITVTESYYCDGLEKPRSYHLEDGRELELAEEQPLNVSDMNGNGKIDPPRFILKQEDLHARLTKEAKRDYKKQPKRNQNTANANMGRRKKGERK